MNIPFESRGETAAKMNYFLTLINKQLAVDDAEHLIDSLSRYYMLRNIENDRYDEDAMIYEL